MAWSRRHGAAVLALAAMHIASGSAARTPPPPEPPPVSTSAPATIEGRADQLPSVLRGETRLEDFLSPAFLSAVPESQFRAIVGAMVNQHGTPRRVSRTEIRNARQAVVFVEFERAVGRVELAIDPGDKGRVIGLLITGFTATDDSLDRVVNDLRLLPGRVSLGVARLHDNRAPEWRLSVEPRRQMAIGSTFKLYILAELANRTAHRSLRWADVVPLDRRSFSSAGTNNWPASAPVTLHSLASWMISVSDNAATDTLLARLGRDAVGARLRAIGHADPDRTLPFLNTVEAFALKSPANRDLREAWHAASEATQRRMLDEQTGRLTLDTIEGSMFTGKPLHIDTLEWFASAEDLVRLLDHLRQKGGTEARTIMAINPGVSADSAARWRYLGYKGGSESGVVSMSWLAEARDGGWYAVTASWNDTDAAVDNGRFAGLMQRLLDQLAARRD